MNALPLQFLKLIFAGWIYRHQQDFIGYLQEENRVLRERLNGKRLRVTDRQRRRLVAKAKEFGRNGAPPDRDPSDPRYSVPMAPSADRQEVRRQQDAKAWSPAVRRDQGLKRALGPTRWLEIDSCNNAACKVGRGPQLLRTEGRVAGRLGSCTVWDRLHHGGSGLARYLNPRESPLAKHKSYEQNHTTQPPERRDRWG